MLLYPKHTNDIQQLERELKLGEDDNMVRLKMQSLDLSFDGGYGEFIGEIKSRLEMIK